MKYNKIYSVKEPFFLLSPYTLQDTPMYAIFSFDYSFIQLPYNWGTLREWDFYKEVHSEHSLI